MKPCIRGCGRHERPGRSTCRPCATVDERERRRARVASDRRACRFCGALKPRSEFVTYTDECLSCRAEAKTCSDCGLRKPVAEFYAERRRHDGLMAACGVCHRQTAARRRATRTARLVAALGEASGWRCYLCELPTRNAGRLEVDHVLPIALGGSDDLANLALVHWRCNRTKAARHPSELVGVR